MYPSVQEVQYLEEREKQIYKVLEKHTRIRYNRLKKIITDEKELGLMSERPFRETLKRMVETGLVKKIPIDKQHVEYTVEFDDIEYEKESAEFFEKLVTDYDDILTKFLKKRVKISKIEQANFIITFLKSVYLTEFWFKEFAYARTNPKIRSLKVDFQNVKDLAKAIALDQGYDDEKEDIYETVNAVMMTESFDMLDKIKQNLVSIK